MNNREFVAMTRNDILWRHYNENNNKLTGQDCRDLLQIKSLNFLWESFKTHGLTPPPIWDKPIEKYGRYADKINEWARAKRLEKGMTYQQFGDALKEELEGHTDRPCKSIANILGQIDRYGYSVPRLVVDKRWRNRKKEIKQSPVCEYPFGEYAEGLPVSSYRVNPENKRQIIYMLK